MSERILTDAELIAIGGRMNKTLGLPVTQRCFGKGQITLRSEKERPGERTLRPGEMLQWKTVDGVEYFLKNVQWFRAMEFFILPPAELKPGGPTVSIIIPACDNLYLTRQCLESVWRQTRDVDCEVILINNGSTDGTKAFLEEIKGRVVALHVEQRVPFAKANDMAAHFAKGDYLVLLNNDTIAHPGWLTEMLKVARGQEGVGIVGSRLVYPSGRVQHAGIAFREKWPTHIYCQSTDAHAPYLLRTREMQAVTGACMLIPRRLFGQFGGFDEAFKNGYEDIDLCLRVREAGYRVICCGRSVLTHYEGRTPGRHDHDAKNHALFMGRWAHRIQDDYEDILAADSSDLVLESSCTRIA